MNIKIIGCGLIGTSIALRLKEKKHEIWLEDSNSSNLHLAKDLVGISGEVPNNFDLIIIATPLKAIIPILRDLNSIKCSAIVIEVGGIKSKVTSEVEVLTDISENFVSAHPMAGRELTGPESARADLFEGRAWILTSSEKTNPKALEVAKKIGDELKIVKEFIQKELIQKDNNYYYLDEINYIEEHIKYIDKMKFYFDDNIDKIVDKSSLERNYITSNCYYVIVYSPVLQLCHLF